MPTTAIVASQILDSGLTGRELIQAADQAAAQAIIGVDPSQYGLLSANNTWTGFNTFQDDLIASFISASSIYTTGSINISEDLEVQGGLIANGAEFSGEVEFTNLITGVGGELQGDLTMSQTADMIVTGGGGYKLYNIGTEGDADTEYLETLADFALGTATPEFRLQSASTGVGVVRGFSIAVGTTSMFTFDSSLVNISHRTLRPNPSNFRDLGTSSYRWANVYSVNGDFSGTVKAPYLSANDPAYTDPVKVRLDGIKGYLYGFNSAVALDWNHTSVKLYKDIYPVIDAASSSGTDTNRWSNTYSVDGSYSGNLNVESGGSQRVYGLGTEGDTDTEYLETSLVGGSFEIETKATGSGAVRTLNLRAGTFRFYAGGSLALASSVGYTLDSYYNIVPKNPTRYLGTTALRWANVASVDGDFSGTVTASNIQDSTGTGNIVLTNDGGSLRRFSDNAIRWGFNSIELKGNVEQWNGGAGNFTLGTSSVPWNTGYFIDGSFSGNLNVESGGSQRVYGLGTEGDADTEYLEIESTGTSHNITTKLTGNGVKRSFILTGASDDYISFYHSGGIIFGRSGTQIATFKTSDCAFNVPITPSVTEARAIGTTAKRWSDVYSVDGDFSGRVLTTRLENLDGNSYIRVSGQASSPIKLWRNTAPQGDNAFDMGADAERFRTVYSVDGSFSGNLNVEVGGSQRLYNLGTEGDTDTEYLETSWDTNYAMIQNKATGAGVARGIKMMTDSATDGIEINNGSMQLFVSNDAKMQVLGSGVNAVNLNPKTSNTYSLGNASNRWQTAVTNGLAVGVQTVSVASPSALNAGRGVTLCDCTTTPITVPLPPAANLTGQLFWIKKTDATANAVTITANGSETIDGSASITLIAEDEAVTLVSDGSNWHISSEFASPTGGNPFDQSLNTTDSPTFVNGDFTGTVTTNLIESAAGNMIIRSSSTSPIYIGHNGALTYGMFNTTFQPQNDNAVQIGAVTKRWSQGHFANVYSVNGTFSGVVTSDANLTLQSNNAQAKISLAESGGVTITAQNSIYQQFVPTGVSYRQPCHPTFDGSVNLGLETLRWANTYSVDGSFSGNLNVEVGGSQRVYNLGSEGDTDTEFISMAWDTNDFKLQTDKTGSGTIQDFDIAGKQVALRHNSGTSISTRLSVDSNSVKVWRNLYGGTDGLYSCGIATNRWANVASVDGDFSGTITTDAIDSTGSLIVSNNGTQKLEITSSRIRPSVNFFPLNDNFVVCGQEGSRWKSVASVKGSFSGNLNTEVGGSQRVYNLGTDGDADTEYL